MIMIKTYREAILEATAEEMRRDDSVIVMGEDVGVYGGGFGATEGLLAEFGPGRVLDTPVSESAFIGAAAGAAAAGMRPVAELMFSDFMAVCWDQIMNEAAKMHFMYAGDVRVPMVIRAAAGAGTGASSQHSQSLESMYCHVPGLKVVIPSTPYDAKGLLKSAIRDNNPVIFLEQKLLYQTSGEVPEDEYTLPIGRADIKRSGSDITLITYGRMVTECLRAAEQAESEGISAEVLDLRTLSPLDTDAVLESVERTGRAVIVHEAVMQGGFGAELSAVIMENTFGRLKAPVKRVCGAFCPVPSGIELEKKVLPEAGSILKAVRAAVSYKTGAN